MHLPHTTPTMAKLLALRHSLTIAKANNLHHFYIETDSSIILHMFDNDHPSYHNLLNECRSLIEETQVFPPTMIFRKQNAVAGSLAKEGARSRVPSLKLFWQMSYFVTNSVQLDCVGVLSNHRTKNASMIQQGWDVALNNVVLAPASIRSTTHFPPELLKNELFLTKKNSKIDLWGVKTM